MVLVQTTLDGARLEIEKIERRLESIESRALKLQTVLYGTLGILRRMGLGEEAEEILARIQQLIAQINMLRLAVWTLYMATGPLGYVMGGIAFAGSFMTLLGSFQL